MFDFILMILRQFQSGMTAQMHIRPDRAMQASAAPGVDDLLALARQYGATAHQLRKQANAASAGPFRLCALHSVELCLSALLLHFGHDWKTIVDHRHDLNWRVQQCERHGLKLKKKTRDFIARHSFTESYKNARYSPGALKDGLHPNQFLAMFAEVADKICRVIQAQPPTVTPPPASA